MVQSCDATDPERASTLALRDEWMNGGPGTAARIVGGYGEALHRGRDIGTVEAALPVD